MKRAAEVGSAARRRPKVPAATVERLFDKASLLTARLAGIDPELYRTSVPPRLPAGALARGVVLFESENRFVHSVADDELEDAAYDPLFVAACKEAARSFLRLKKDVADMEDAVGELRELRWWHFAHFAIRMFRAGYQTAQEQAADPHRS